LSASVMSKAGVSVAVEVTNTGTKPGDEIVQLYIRDQISSITRPVKELRNYKRISLNTGETKKVSFDVSLEELAFYDMDMNWVAEAGTFTLMIGGSSLDQDLKTIELKLAKTIDLEK